MTLLLSQPLLFDLDQQQSNGLTFLGEAVYRGEEVRRRDDVYSVDFMAKALLEVGCDVNAKDASGLTALHHVVLLSQKRDDVDGIFEIN